MNTASNKYVILQHGGLMTKRVQKYTNVHESLLKCCFICDSVFMLQAARPLGKIKSWCINRTYIHKLAGAILLREMPQACDAQVSAGQK